MANLERIKKFVFKGEEYQIEFPTVGEYIDIENQKLIQSNGQWINLIKNQTVSALRSIQIIECVSTLMVLCPKLFGNMKVTSYKEIEIPDNPNHEDEMKVINEFPGTPCGYCMALQTIAVNKKPIEITRFYDSRQKGLNKLRNFYISLKQ